MVPRNRLHSIGWATLLVIALALFGALTIKVNSVKSQVRQAERQIVALLQQQAETRVPDLVPIRHGRMSASAFANYRGAALMMADRATAVIP